MIYVARTDHGLCAYYNYDDNIGGYFFEEELDDFIRDKQAVVLDKQLPIKKVERYLVNYAISNELKQNRRGRGCRPFYGNK